MVQLVLTEEQLRRFEKHEPIQLCNPEGQVIYTIDLENTPEFIAELKRRAASPGPWFSGDQVQTRLQSLQQEWDRTGGFDEEHLRDLLDRLDKQDPGHMRSQEPGE